MSETQRQPGLNLSYDIEPDSHGVFDGRELAACMIRYAYLLLLPYVNSCRACGDNLFTVLANEEIEKMHQAGDDPGMVLATVTESEKPEAVRAHMAAAESRTRELLTAADAQGHEHG